MLWEMSAKWLRENMGANQVTAWMEEQAEAARRREAIQKICQKAMQRAELDPATHPIKLLDIGLLAYRTPKTPKLVRVQPILSDTLYLRPFVELSAPMSRQALIMLEIRDPAHHILFADAGLYSLHRQTKIIPKTWLPLHNQQVQLQGEWWMTVWMDDHPLAAHPFIWEVLADNDILAHLRNDGEISDELRQEVQHGRFRTMSLDELLADQEE